MKKNPKKSTHKKKNKSRTRHFSENLAKTVVNLLDRNPAERYSIRQIAKSLKLKGHKAKVQLEEVLDKLIFERKINLIHGKTYQSAVGKGNKLIGIVDFVNPSFAYLIVEDRENDVWVSANKLNGALDGDKVAFTVHRGQRRNREEGKVIEVLERSRTEFAGKVEMSRHFAFVVPSYRKMYEDIFVSKEHINGAKAGQKVVVKVTDWPKKGRNPEGEIVRVLGESGENETEIHSIMFEYGLPFEFPKNVEKAAQSLQNKISEKEIAHRRDFREVTTFTIDPANAKDFDDALSIRRLDNGDWEVGIHIADVTHYVRPGSILEEEAFKRATSVYLVDRTVPMLPERLSNELCSLRPREEKLCFSAVFTLTDRAKVTSEWFGRTVIFSDHRFTYEQAQEELETGEGRFPKALQKLNSLAKYLRGRRYRAGAVSFETPEFYFDLDEQGKPIGVHPKIRKDAHKLVEEFMLLANRKVAEWVHSRKKGRGKQQNTMVYRVHEDPDPERVETFVGFAKRFGYEVANDNKQLAASINQMIEASENKPEQNILQYQAIRTMAKARYTTEPIGHYGLAFKHYTHFTSPIRRYPDMMAHRLLQHYLNGGAPPEAEPLEEACKHASTREKVATDAERASIKYKQVEFMASYLGRELDGMVSGVTEWGIYVELDETRCEGMVKLSEMKDDFYSFDEEQQMVIGREFKQTYSIGDRVTIRVKGTNLDRRTIDFEML